MKSCVRMHLELDAEKPECHCLGLINNDHDNIKKNVITRSHGIK